MSLDRLDTRYLLPDWSCIRIGRVGHTIKPRVDPTGTHYCSQVGWFVTVRAGIRSVQNRFPIRTELINCVFRSVRSHPFWIPDWFGTSIQSVLKDTKNRPIS